jgi:hypothetical protein
VVININIIRYSEEDKWITNTPIGSFTKPVPISYNTPIILWIGILGGRRPSNGLKEKISLSSSALVTPPVIGAM